MAVMEGRAIKPQIAALQVDRSSPDGIHALGIHMVIRYTLKSGSDDLVSVISARFFVKIYGTAIARLS